MRGHQGLWFVPAVFISLVIATFLAWMNFPDSEKLHLVPLSWDAVQGFEQESLKGFEDAYSYSCARLETLSPTQPMGIGEVSLRAVDWQSACAQVQAKIKTGQAKDQILNRDQILKDAIQTVYRPYLLSKGRKKAGHFTGYYVPLLQGSLTPAAKYPIPLYRRPDYLIDVDLGEFRRDLKGQRIAGQVKGHRLIPFASRAGIDAGALNGQGLELLWVSDASDAFFLHIQGSGHIRLENGDILRVGYDGQNGHPYYAIGRTLIAEGEIAQKDMSLSAITTWLETHPDRADALMQENASYVFFRLLEGDGVIGAQDVVLTAGRSLAVDRSVLPLGIPIWVKTQLNDGQDFDHLMMAQDTGGAIKGIGRGDIFFGPGVDAQRQAGSLNAKGEMIILIPLSGASFP